MKKLLDARNIVTTFTNEKIESTVVDDVSFYINPGEIIGLVGESGSGKTTLLNVISGLDSYEEGEMYINGQETSHYLAADFEQYRKKYIGNIFQHYNLINSYTVYQNIEIVLPSQNPRQGQP